VWRRFGVPTFGVSHTVSIPASLVALLRISDPRLGSVGATELTNVEPDELKKTAKTYLLPAGDRSAPSGGFLTLRVVTLSAGSGGTIPAYYCLSAGSPILIQAGGMAEVVCPMLFHRLLQE
jgi:hypothetical protein